MAMPACRRSWTGTLPGADRKKSEGELQIEDCGLQIEAAIQSAIYNLRSAMQQYRAAWVLPISQPPIRDGWILTERGRIVAFGHSRANDLPPSNEIDLGDVAVLPALVNAHTHLELSWMRGRIPPTEDFPGWIRDVIALQRRGPDSKDAELAAIRTAIAEARATGTGLLGDVSNTLSSVAPLIAAGGPALVFHELIGFKQERATATIDEALQRLAALPPAGEVRHTLAAHAPYSVSPALFQAIRTALGREPFARCSVHLGESGAETEFLREGAGPWRRLLEDIGAWDPAWETPKCDPVEYLDRMGFIDARMLVVHGVHLQEPALVRLAARGATLVTCPRGNRLTGAGSPPIADFYEAGVPVAVGTDSLASVPDLNLFSELAELRRLGPHVPASRLIESATLSGARALGFESDYGSIDAGKRDAVIAVAVPPGTRDVEEYLVNGIPSADVSHLNGSGGFTPR
jgi:cytosine/adenosine deaminase-related metal-dependent hydrolase